MTNKEWNIVKLADLIAQIEDSGRYLTDNESLVILNSLVDIHAKASGTTPMHYDQTEPEAAKDYDDNL
jgi:hypothetical protein